MSYYLTPPPRPKKIKSRKVVEVRPGEEVPANGVLIHVRDLQAFGCVPVFYYEYIEYVE